MKKDMIFFSENGKGLTSTSANHLANVAKEMIRELETELAEMTFYSTTVSLIGTDNVNLLNQGATDEDVKKITTLLRRVAESKSLIAWLREAIKAKERLQDEVLKESLEEYARSNGIELKERPVMGEILTEDDYFASLSADERCRYYSLEALASTLGKAIHPGGEFADARKALQLKGKKPHDVEGSGRDTLIYTYSPTVDEHLVEDVYFGLQAQYRDVQSRLNTIKSECKKAVDDSAVTVKSEYAKNIADWTNERKLLETRHAQHVQLRSREIAELRILIPQSLTDIYNHVTGLGKKTGQ